MNTKDREAETHDTMSRVSILHPHAPELRFLDKSQGQEYAILERLERLGAFDEGYFNILSPPPPCLLKSTTRVVGGIKEW